jgi:hypothetical protein
MFHRYQVRQLVRLTHSSFSDIRASASAISEVTRLMPADQTREGSYPIKLAGASERAVWKNEMTARVSDT